MGIKKHYDVMWAGNASFGGYYTMPQEDVLLVSIPHDENILVPITVDIVNTHIMSAYDLKATKIVKIVNFKDRFEITFGIE